MKYLDLTCATPAESLACDEALLDACAEGDGDETLRFWEPRQPFVVVGYANRVATEVNLAACRERAIPVLRRCTGGGTVLQAAGCLNYSLILRISDSGPLQSVTGTNEFVLKRHGEALGPALGKSVTAEGATDLASGGRKFAGNAQRRKRDCLLFHGSFLLGLDFDLLDAVLPFPSQQPGYRRHRSHREFLINLQVAPEVIRAALRTRWNAVDPVTAPADRIAKLTREKYETAEWNSKF